MLRTMPGLSAKPDPTVHRAVHEHRLKLIDQRRAEIEAALKAIENPDHRSRFESGKQVELEAELRTLNSIRREIAEVLRPTPQPPLSPELAKARAEQRDRDKILLRSSIKQQIAQTEDAARKLDAAGEYRQARLQRSLIPDIPQQVLEEFDLDPSLLAEIAAEEET